MRQKCLRSLYAISQDKDASKCEIMSKLSKFGVSYNKWYRWKTRSGWENHISSFDKDRVVSEYEAYKHNRNTSTFVHMMKFYSSDFYKNNVRWSRFLNIQNYWYWRKHFYERLCVDHDNSFIPDQWRTQLSDQPEVTDVRDSDIVYESSSTDDDNGSSTTHDDNNDNDDDDDDDDNSDIESDEIDNTSIATILCIDYENDA